MHLTSPGPSGIGAWLLARVLDLPVIGSYHTELAAYAGLRSGAAQLEAIAGAALGVFYGACDVVLSPSPASDERLAELGIASHRVARWDRGVDLDRFDPRLRDAEMFGGKVNVMYCGRLTREKGVDLLADAFLRAREEDPRLHLVLAGGGPEEAVLRERLGDHGTFMGWLSGSDLPTAYASADAFLFASRTDTFGQVILEAQASGLPVVAVAEGGPMSLIAHGETGLLAEPTPEALASALLSVVRTPALRERLRKTALATVQERTWGASLRQLASGYRSALLHSAAPGRAQALARRSSQNAVARASGMTRSAPALRSWPPTMASVQPEPRRSSSRTPAPGGGRPTTRKAPRTLAACCTALAISAWGGRASVRSSRDSAGTPSCAATCAARRSSRLAEADRRDRRDPGHVAGARLRAGPRADRVGQRSHDLILEALAAQAPLHRRPPAAVAEAGQRPPGLDADVLGDLAHRARRVGRHLLDLELDRRRAQVAAGQLHQRRVRRRAEAGGGADRAAAAVLGLRIVELRLQHAHEAAPVGAEALHRPLLLAAQRGDARVALAVIAPVRVLRQHPARTVAAQRPLDVEDLEHRLQPAPADVDHAEQLLGAAAAVPGGAQVVEHRGDALA